MENKELYKDVSDIKVKTASTDAKMDHVLKELNKIDDIKSIAVRADNGVTNLNERVKNLEKAKTHIVSSTSKSESELSSLEGRVDKIEKWKYAIGSVIILAVVSSILGLILV